MSKKVGGRKQYPIRNALRRLFWKTGPTDWGCSRQPAWNLMPQFSPNLEMASQKWSCSPLYSHPGLPSVPAFATLCCIFHVCLFLFHQILIEDLLLYAMPHVVLQKHKGKNTIEMDLRELIIQQALCICPIPSYKGHYHLWQIMTHV